METINLTSALQQNAAAVANLLPFGTSEVHEGVFIMYHRASDNFPVVAKLPAWAALQTSGEIADGVLLVQGGRTLVIAPTDIALTWSSAAKSVGATTSDRLTALADFDGKVKTAAVCADATLSADGAAYAPGWCNEYSRANANGLGLLAGQWWLPSLGELMLIFGNVLRINYALSLIAGATQIPSSAHWSITETSASYAWNLSFSNGSMSGYNKVSTSLRVRPVSAFIA